MKKREQKQRDLEALTEQFKNANAAMLVSFKNMTVDPHTAVFGEVGLTGEVRGAMQASVRAREAQALGFKKIVMPASNVPGLERLLGVRVVGVRSVEDALDEIF